MKPLLLIPWLLLPAGVGAAEEEKSEKSPEMVAAEHRQNSAKIADRQDELSGDVQQLAVEQSIPQVIELLNEVEAIMDETTDQLAEADTGGKTLAAQTEIIEKIHAAAKARQQQSGSGQSGSAMMDMMERMMGKAPEGDQPGKGKDGKPGESPGNGGSGESDAANEMAGGAGNGKSETRRVPKAGGSAGRAMPEEFQKALDAYNRGAEEKVK
jgi:hypothetical protein